MFVVLCIEAPRISERFSEVTRWTAFEEEHIYRGGLGRRGGSSQLRRGNSSGSVQWLAGGSLRHTAEEAPQEKTPPQEGAQEGRETQTFVRFREASQAKEEFGLQMMHIAADSYSSEHLILSIYFPLVFSIFAFESMNFKDKS